MSARRDLNEKRSRVRHLLKQGFSLAKHCGPLQAPPPAATKAYPALCAAPITYVLER